MASSCPSPARDTVRSSCGSQRGEDTSRPGFCPRAFFDSANGLQAQPPGCRGGPSLESLRQDRGGVLRLAAITCEALLRLQATVLSSVGLLFGVSCRWGHDALLDAMWVCGGDRLSTCTCPLAWVRTGSPCVTCSQDFRLSFLNHLRYKGARTALPMPTPSAARRIGIERGGDDL